MKFIVAKIYADDDCIYHSMTDVVLYEEIGKKAIALTDSCYRRYNKSRIIDGAEYSSFNIYLFIPDWTSNNEKCYNIAKDCCEALEINNVVLIDLEDCGFTHLYETDNGFGYSCKRLIQTAKIEELMAFVRSNNNFFYDWIINNPLSKEENIKLSSDTIHSSDLNYEIKRMYQCSKKDNALNNGVPVHYILEGYNKSHYKNSLEVMLSALRDSNRIGSHIFQFNFDKINKDDSYPIVGKVHSTFTDYLNSNLSNALCGNTVIVQYGIHDEENSFDNSSYVAFTKFVESLKPIMEYTPIIFSIPSNKNNLIRRIEKIVDMPLATIKLDSAFSAKDKSFEENYSYLKNIAKKRGFVPDKKLQFMLKSRMQDKSLDDIDALLDNWVSESRIENQFPQYSKELEHTKDIRGQKEPAAMTQLDELIGLDSVKEQIRNILNRFKMNEKCKMEGLPVQDFSMHMAFLGNPGTGKTEVAKLFGQILKESNILSEGRVFSVSGTNFPTNSDDLFKRAKGSIIFIDEAYELYLKDATLASLIANMENYREDTVVILAGYENSMNAMLDCNIGFRSRLGFTLMFDDYSQDELLDIFKLMMSRANLHMSKDTLSLVRDILWRGGRRLDQGNGRYVRKFFEDCVGRQQVRLAKMNKDKYSPDELSLICEEDINPKAKLNFSAVDEFSKLIGLNDVKQLVNKRINYMAMMKLRRDNGYKSECIPMNMAFIGNPGTGKTEVARYFGKILNEKGVMSVGDFYECHPGDLSSPKIVDSLFQKARGSVIFVDEAYTLANLHPAVLGAFMKNMEDYKDEVIIIFAGYTNEIDELLKSNPGFQSRITAKINFNDYSTEELIQIAEYIANKKQYKLCGSSKKRLKTIVDKCKNTKDFGNARFIRNIIESAIINQSDRLLNMGTKPTKKQLLELQARDFDNVDINKSNTGNRSIGFMSAA